MFAKSPLGRALVTIILFGLPGCASPTDTESFVEVNVVVNDTIISVNSESEVVHATLTLTVENTGSTSIMYNRCGNAVQRARGDVVWWPICPLIADPDIEIAAGEQYVDEIYVNRRLDEPFAPEWREPISGEYVLVAALYTKERGELPIGMRSSKAFQLREG